MYCILYTYDGHWTSKIYVPPNEGGLVYGTYRNGHLAVKVEVKN